MAALILLKNECLNVATLEHSLQKAVQVHHFLKVYIFNCEINKQINNRNVIQL